MYVEMVIGQVCDVVYGQCIGFVFLLVGIVDG